MSVNKIILVGRVGKDPDIRGFDNGRSKASFSLATDERYKNRSGERVDRTEWHHVVMWSPLAEIVEKYVRKGMLLYVEGRIQTRSYEDKEGQTRYITEVDAREMKMLTTRAEAESMGHHRDPTTSSDDPQAPPRTQAPSSSTAPSAAEPPDPDQVDDLPF